MATLSNAVLFNSFLKQDTNLRFFIQRSIVAFFLMAAIATTALGQLPKAMEVDMFLASDGFIITKAGDTIPGKIRITKYIENQYGRIRFTGYNGEKASYNPDEITGFGVYPYGGGFSYYEVRASAKKGVPIYVCAFIKGKINVFFNRSSICRSVGTTTETTKTTGIDFEIAPKQGLQISPETETTRQTNITSIWYSSYFVEKNDAPLIKVDKNNLPELWPTLFGDCPALEAEVAKYPDLKQFKNFLKLVDTYNQLCN